jgi:hypothetical protein
MSDTPGPANTGDKGPKEEKLSMNVPVGDVEMEDLSSTQPKPANPDDNTAATMSSPSENNKEGEPDQSTPLPVPDKDPTTSASTSKAQGKAPATAPTEDQSLSIDPIESPGEGPAEGDLVVDIMLLLTTGARHPFKIDEKYLTKRNVTVTVKTEDGKMDPFSITVYTLKELILRDWRKEWSAPPREPSAIRLIHFGKLLEDRMPLSRKF